MKTLNQVRFIVIFCLILITYTSSPSSACPLTSDHVNVQTLHHHAISCLQKALRHGWQQVTDYLIQHRDSQLHSQFIRVFQQQVKRLEILQQQIVLGTSETEPILKWGQNRTHVFVTFKLSHRWDSPPCLYTQSEKSRLEEDSFFYDNVCLVSHQKVTFRIHLNLYRKVQLSIDHNPQQDKQSNYQRQDSQSQQSREQSPHLNSFTSYTFDVKKDGVGQYSTILLKQSPQIWTFLTREQKLYPIWHEISQRYPEDFNQYEQAVSNYKILQKQQADQRRQQSRISSQSYLLSLKVSSVLLLVIVFVAVY